MKTTENSNSLVTLASQGQKGIPGMLEIVNQKIKELKGDGPKTPSTQGKKVLGFKPIAETKSVSELIKMHSAVVNRAKMYRESAELLLKDNSNKYPYKLEGCSESQWVEDIRTRLFSLINELELTKLLETKRLLETNLSQEAKLANDLAKIAEMYSDNTLIE